MAISNGIYYSQRNGLIVSTNNLNRVIVSTAGTTTFTASTTGVTLVNVNNSAGGTVFSVNSDGSVIGGTPTTNTFVISGTNIGVGGILTPTNRLHISASTNPIRIEGIQLSGSSSNDRFLVTDSSGVVTYRTDVVTTAMTATTLYTGDGSLSGNRVVNIGSNTLNFSSSTQPNTLVLSGGNVGIDVSAPTNPLHVSAATNPVRIQGLQSVLNSRFLVTDTNGVMTFRTDVVTTGTLPATLYTGNGTLASNRVVTLAGNSLNFSGTAQQNALFIQTNGNVGIGTNNPSHRLDVNGDINFPSTTGSTFGILRQNGARLLHTFGSNNLFLGVNAGNFVVSGTNNVTIGTSALNNVITGNNNIGIGSSAGVSVNSGSNNIGIGTSAGNTITDGNLNISIGTDSNSINGFYSTIVGNLSLSTGLEGRSHTGNTSLGFANFVLDREESSYFGNYNVAVGYLALSNYGLSGEQTVIGDKNVAIGPYAGYGKTSGDSKLFIANNSGTTLIYGDFTANTVGINTENPTNALHVSAATDPLRLINVQPANDDFILTQDASGVVHYRNIDSIGIPDEKIVLRTIDLGTVDLSTDFTIRNVGLLESRLSDSIFIGTQINYSGANISYYFTLTSGSTRQKYLWSAETLYNEYNPTAVFTSAYNYLSPTFTSTTLVNFYCEVYLDISKDCSAPTQVKLTNTLFNSLNPFKYTRSRNYEGRAEFVRSNFNVDYGEQTIEGDVRLGAWEIYYDVLTSNDILKVIYNIVDNEPTFYGTLSAKSENAIINGLSWDKSTREVIQNSVYVEKNTDFYSKYRIPVNTHGFNDICKNRKNNFYGDLFYDNSSGSEPSVVYDNSNQSDNRSSAVIQIIDTYRICASGTPAVIYTNNLYDKYTYLNDLSYSMDIDSSIKYLTKNRDKSYVQVLPGYQNIYIIKVNVTGDATFEEVSTFFNNFINTYLVINDPSLNYNNEYWLQIFGGSISYFESAANFASNPYGPYIIIQSNDNKMNQLGALGSISLGSGFVDILAIYKGYSFRPLIYPLNLNQLTLEVPHSYVYNNNTNSLDSTNVNCDNFNIITADTQYRAGIINFDLAFDDEGGANNEIYATDIQADGKILVGGKFDEYDGDSKKRYIARINDDGTLDTTFNVGGDCANEIVRAIAIQSDGKILIGGDFTQYDDSSGTYNVDYIARLNTDGTLDTTFNIGGTGFNGFVNTIVIQSDGKILVGGGFDWYQDNIAKHSINNIIRLNTDGTYDSTFNNGGSGAGGIVYDIAIQSDGKILIGGAFDSYTDVNGVTGMGRIIRLNTNGIYDTTFNNSGLGFNDNVRAIDIQSNGKIVVGGDFTTYNDISSTYSMNRITRLNTDGMFDTTFNTDGAGFNDVIYTISVQSDDTIFVGGLATNYNSSITVYGAINLTNDGGVDLSFNIGTGFYNTINTLYIYCSKIKNNFIYVGGSFNGYQDWDKIENFIVITGKNLMVPQKAGINNREFIPNGYAFDNYVRAVAIQSDKKVIVGGNFTSYSGTSPYGYILRLNSNGSIDNNFQHVGGFDNIVNTIKILAGGKILVGGAFNTYVDGVGTYSTNFIARLNLDGTFDTTFNSGGSGFDGPINIISLQSDGKILVGGGFTTYNDSSGTYSIVGIARLNPDGTFDTTFNSGGTGFDTTVITIAIQSDEKILVGGNFTQYNDVNGTYFKYYIIRLNTDGTHDSTFVATGTNGIVHSVAIQPNGKILIGGDFTQYDDSITTYNVGHIVRVNLDGTVDGFFSSGIGFNQSVYTIAVHPNGKILVGGRFTEYDTSITPSDNVSHYIASLNSDGTLNKLFNSSIKYNNTRPFEFSSEVFCLTFDSDFNVFVGGDFTKYNFAPAERLVKLYAEDSTGYNIDNKYLRFIIKYTKLQKYDLITVPIKLTNIRAAYDSKFNKITLSDFFESFEMNIYKNLSHSKRKQLRPNSVEIYMGFYDLETNITSMIPNYKIVMVNYGDNEVFKLIRGNVVINSVSP